MMRRHAFWFRAAASLLALWLPLVAGEPGLLQPCAMHGAERLVIASLAGHPAPVAAHVMDHAAHMHHAASSHAPAQNHDHHNCTCISCCSAAAAGFVAPAMPDVIVAVVTIAADRSVPTVESLARPAPNYDPPLTTGPPRIERGASRA